MNKISFSPKDGRFTTKFKVIFGIVIGFNIIAFMVLLIWIALNLKSVLDRLGL